MTWIDDNKDAGPWDFTEQKNKWGYLNNKRWSLSAANQAFAQSIGLSVDPDIHNPCGHWHKDPVIETLEYDNIRFWQQSVDVLKDEGITAIAGVSYDEEGYYIIQLYDADNNLIAAKVWDTIYNSGYAMQIKLRSYNGEIKAFYANYDENEDGSGENVLYMYTLTTTGVSSKTLLFEHVYVSWDQPYQFLWESLGKQTIAISSTGVVVCITDVYGDDGVAVYDGFVSRRSVDGVNWDSEVLVKVENYYDYTVIVVDSSNNFHTFVNISGDVPQHPFDMWTSSDGGNSWSEILTTPATPAGRGRELAAAISGTKIYVLTYVNDGGSYVSYVYYTTNGGTTWTANAVSIPGDSYFYQISFFAYNNVIVFIGKGATTNKHYLFRSTDAGVTWTKIGQIDPELTWPTFMPEYSNIPAFNQDEDIFIYTHCNSYLLGADNLAYLKSVNSGENWTVEEIPMANTSDKQTVVGYSSTTINEPQVWALP